jgi:hypothetical protein
MKHTTIAVDLAKSVFEVAVSRRPGKVAKCHRHASVPSGARFSLREEPRYALLGGRARDHAKASWPHGPLRGSSAVEVSVRAGVTKSSRTSVRA